MNPCLCQLASPGRPKLTIAAHFSSQRLLRLLQCSIRLHRRSKPKRRFRKSRSSSVDELAAVIAYGSSSTSSHGIGVNVGNRVPGLLRGEGVTHGRKRFVLSAQGEPVSPHTRPPYNGHGAHTVGGGVRCWPTRARPDDICPWFHMCTQAETQSKSDMGQPEFRGRTKRGPSTRSA